MALITIVKWADGVNGTVEVQAERVRLDVDIPLSRSRVACQYIDLCGNRIPPVANADRRRASVIAVRIGGIHGRRAGCRNAGVEAVFDLKVLDSLDERYDGDTRPEFRTHEGRNAVTGLVIVGNEVDIGQVPVLSGQ